jgi:hypothetical protein
MTIERVILLYLSKGNKLSVFDLISVTGATSADVRLRELRRSGWDIKSKWCDGTKGVRYMRHYMEKDEQKRASKWLKGKSCK